MLPEVNLMIDVSFEAKSVLADFHRYQDMYKQGLYTEDELREVTGLHAINLIHEPHFVEKCAWAFKYVFFCWKNRI